MNKWLDKIEARFERFCIPNLTLVLVAGQGTCFIIGSFHPELLSLLPLSSSLILKGEAWRLVTFMFYPLDTHPIFAFFAYYLFYIMGTALEEEWGAPKYNLYILIGYAATLAFSFVIPFAAFVNTFITMSVFLAFAFLFPDFLLYLFFIIPVKIKYLAGVVLIVYGLSFIGGGWPTRVAILISLANYFLFFGKDIWGRIRTGKRQMTSKVDQIREDSTPFHVCHACGLTEKKSPYMLFRVCGTCAGGLEYCADHLHTHTHSHKS